MTISRNDVRSSRADNSRPASVARSIIQRRDKPYRTEKAAVLASKRKLDLQTTYTDAPAGYSYLPYGTPELSDRCKELSRNQGLPVYIVNATPASRYADDPDKVSHHVHRIGYHFNAKIVAEACLELGYTMHKGRFVKETDLAEQNNRSRMAQIMASHGYAMQNINAEDREDTDQLRGAMRELFPRIPDVDMEAIIKHAWQDGSLRVGTNATLTLSRRIQLATIARIRHTYTDYDALLKAFGDWHAVRRQVEPECLAKIKEWRGENAQNDAEELEWITREYIVIDDDDDVIDNANKGHDADDEDSSADQGYASETSIEITHHRARDEDLGAESSNETALRYIERLQPRQYRRPRAPAQPHLAEYFTAHTRPKSNGAPSAYDESSPQYYSQPPPQTHTLFPRPAGLQYDSRDEATVGDRYDRPIMLSSPPPAARLEFSHAPPPTAPVHYTDPNPAPPPAYRTGNGPDEMILNGQIYRKVPLDREAVPQQTPVFQPDAAVQSSMQPHNPYISALPSIEGYAPLQPQGREDWRRGRNFGLAAPQYPPVPKRQRLDYIDLRSPEMEQRSAPRPPPVHGAPAPIQQIPRGGHYAR